MDRATRGEVGLTDFMEAVFLRFAAAGVREDDQVLLPLGSCRTSPICAADEAPGLSNLLSDPVPHLGTIYDLAGTESADLEHYARTFPWRSADLSVTGPAVACPRSPCWMGKAASRGLDWCLSLPQLAGAPSQRLELRAPRAFEG